MAALNINARRGKPPAITNWSSIFSRSTTRIVTASSPTSKFIRCTTASVLTRGISNTSRSWDCRSKTGLHALSAFRVGRQAAW